MNIRKIIPLISYETTWYVFVNHNTNLKIVSYSPLLAAGTINN